MADARYVRRRAAAVTGSLMLALLASAAPAAHHSFSAQFDGNKPITLRGTVKRMSWSNPHGHLFIDVTNADGRVVTWELETDSPSSLFRRGWTREDIPVGKAVVVRGFLARDGTPTANARTITIVETGKELFAGSANAGDPAAER
jgi:hypothetical protein